MLTVPYQVIYALLEVKDGTNREVEAGIQLLGVILVNGLPPYSPDSTALKTKYCIVMCWFSHYNLKRNSKQ